MWGYTLVPLVSEDVDAHYGTSQSDHEVVLSTFDATVKQIPTRYKLHGFVCDIYRASSQVVLRYASSQTRWSQNTRGYPVPADF